MNRSNDPEIPNPAFWQLTDNGMQLIAPDSEAARSLAESLNDGSLAPSPEDTHTMRLGSILVASENSFAFHPDDIQEAKK